MHQHGAVAEVADVGCDIGTRGGRAPGQAALLLRISAGQGLCPSIAMGPRRIAHPHVASLPTPKLSQTHSQSSVRSALSVACWITVMLTSNCGVNGRTQEAHVKDDDKYWPCKAGTHRKDILNDAIGVLLGVR